MHIWASLVVFASLLAVTLLSVLAGVWLGQRRRHAPQPDGEYLRAIQAALLGLLGLILGFSFSGAMSRFIDRQDSLWVEASAIETAYHRAELVPTGDRIQRSLRAYAALRLDLFHETRTGPAAELTRRMRAHADDARAAVYEGVREVPQFASLIVQGLEAVSDQFTRRSALASRRLPTEMLVVLITSSCVCMGMLGCGVGLAERRSVGAGPCSPH